MRSRIRPRRGGRKGGGESGGRCVPVHGGRLVPTEAAARQGAACAEAAEPGSTTAKRRGSELSCAGSVAASAQPGARDRLVRQAGDLGGALLDDDQVEDRDVAGDDAAAHTLAVPLTLPHAVSPAALHACIG